MKIKIMMLLALLLSVSASWAGENYELEAVAITNGNGSTELTTSETVMHSVMVNDILSKNYQVSKDAVKAPTAAEMKYGSYTPLREFEITTVPLVAFGFIAKGNKHNFRAARNNFIPSYKNRIDDMLQHGPLILTTAFNLAGYEGRSNFKRYLISGGASYIVMAAIVNGIKYTAKEMRPDGSTANSFPSGHTATAFTAATIMHKEYGLTRSPWWSVLAYGCATTTGIMRTLNNRHWISDILVGAGIGVISTDLGYMIGDLLMKKKGINREKREDVTDMIKSPSFFRLSLGMQSISDLSLPSVAQYTTMERLWSAPGSDMLADDYYTVVRNGNPYGEGVAAPRVKVSMGTTVGAEGAYFFNPYIGAGLRARITTAPVVADGIKGYDGKPTNSATDVWSIADFGVGIYGSLPINSRHNVGVKAMYGRRFFGELDMMAVNDCQYYYPDAPDVLLNSERYGDDLWIDKTSTDNFTVGAHYTYSAGSGVALSAFVDYDYSKPEFTVEYAKFQNDATAIALGSSEFKYKQKVNSLTIGASMTVLF